MFYGGGGLDIMNGNLGDDTLNGGDGNDTLAGGDGAMQYEFEVRDQLNAANEKAAEVHAGMVMIGILPTLTPEYVRANQRSLCELECAALSGYTFDTTSNKKWYLEQRRFQLESLHPDNAQRDVPARARKAPEQPAQRAAQRQHLSLAAGQRARGPLEREVAEADLDERVERAHEVLEQRADRRAGQHPGDPLQVRLAVAPQVENPGGIGGVHPGFGARREFRIGGMHQDQVDQLLFLQRFGGVALEHRRRRPVAAADADSAARAILVAAVAMGGCVGAMALIGAWIGGDR